MPGTPIFGDDPNAVSIGGMALIVADGLWSRRGQKSSGEVAETPD